MSKFDKRNLLEEKGVKNYNEAIELSYQILRNKCTMEDMPNRIESKGRYRLVLLDMDENETVKDTIYITLSNGGQMKFLISKFLQGKRLKYDLIQYYSDMNIYVRGPYIATNEDKQNESWVIDFSFFKTKTVLENPDKDKDKTPAGDFYQPDEEEDFFNIGTEVENAETESESV